MSIVNFTTEDGKTYKKIVRLAGFNIGGTEYKCTTALRMQGATIETPIYSSASMRVIIRAAFSSESRGYLFGDSRFNIQVDGNNLKFMHDGTIETTKEIEPNRVYEFGFIDGVPFFQGELEKATSTSNTGTEKCLIGGAVGKMPITDLILYRIDVYGHYNTTSDRKEAYAYYPCKQGTTAYMVEKWSNSLAPITIITTGSASIYNPNEEEVVYGIELNELRSIIGSGRKDLVAMTHEDKDLNITGNSYDRVVDKDNVIQLKSCFRMIDRPLPSGYSISSLPGNVELDDGDLIQGRTPYWNLWADDISIGKKLRGKYTTDEITYYASQLGEGGTVNVRDNQQGHIIVNILHDDDKRVHLEDFEGYCHNTFHKPAIYLDGQEVNDFSEMITDENGGSIIRYKQLLTTFFSDFPMGGGKVVQKQMTNPDGYLMYKVREDSFAFENFYDPDTSYYVPIIATKESKIGDVEGTYSSGNYLYIYYERTNTYTDTSFNDSEGRYQILTMEDLEPYYYKNEQGVTGEKIQHTPVFTSSQSTYDKDNNSHVTISSKKVNVLKYLPPSGFDFRFKIGNIVNWNKAQTYEGVELTGAYFALRLLDSMDVDLGLGTEEVNGLPLMLGYRYSSQALGLNTSDELKKELLEDGVEVEDIFRSLDRKYINAIKAYSEFNSRYLCYGELGLLKKGLSPIRLGELQNYCYSARRIFKNMVAALYIDSTNEPTIIIKGMEKDFGDYKVNIIAARDVISGVEYDGTENTYMLLRNKAVVMMCAITDKSNNIVQNKKVKATLTVYREDRTYTSTGMVNGLTTYDPKSVEKTSLNMQYMYDNYSTNNLAPWGLFTDYGINVIAGNQNVTYKKPYYFTINGDQKGEVPRTFVDQGMTGADNYYPYLLWRAQDFADSGNTISRNLSSSEAEYQANDNYIFQPNCTYVIEITGVL